MSVVNIANLAGVSKSTVSRVINGSAFVDPETKQRVEEAIDRLGYRPPAVRRGPKLGSRRAQLVGQIGLLAADRNAANLYNMPVFPKLLHGVQLGLAERRLELVLLNHGEVGTLPAGLSPRRLDGLFLIGRHGAPTIARIVELNVPTVWLMRAHSDTRGRFDHVFYNNDSVGSLAAHWLLDRGHRNVAFLNATAEHSAFPARERRFAETIAYAGAHVEQFVAINEDGGMQPLVDKLMMLRQKPTAVFVPNDAQVPALYLALARRGITAGREIAVVSCDNERGIIGQLSPVPTTIDLNLESVGRRGVEQLLSRIKHRNERERVTVLIEPTIVEPAATADTPATP